VYTPDDVLQSLEENNLSMSGPVLIYDDDHYYMGGVLAELFVDLGFEVILVTTAAVVSSWTEYSLEQGRIQSNLHKRGVHIIVNHTLNKIQSESVTLSYVYTGEPKHIEAAAVILVTSMNPVDSLYHDLVTRKNEWADSGLQKVSRIGDCYGPGTIAQAVWLGHKYAHTLDESEYQNQDVPFDRELVTLSEKF
jgi:dimethylamine/trimethylamine dehydrogenase